MKSFRQAFTLIELIVVVTILAILAIIALPNFHEAHIRSQVATVKNNMRKLALQFEMLNLDTNRYPLAGKWRYVIIARRTFWMGQHTNYQEDFQKAYKAMYGPYEDIFEYLGLKHENMLDSEWFMLSPGGPNQRLCNGFNFFEPKYMVEALEKGCEWEDCDIETWRILTDMAGGWILYSPGPDLVAESPAWIYVPDVATLTITPNNYHEKMLFHEYDPTNGTVSYGNIFRTQKNPGGLGTNPYFY